MLSKVLKGDNAREVPVMAFAMAASSIRKPASPSAPAAPATSEDQSILHEKIRALEAGLVIAKREAFNAGREQGEQTARAAVNPVIERLNASIVEVLSLRPDLRRRAEKDAVGLSLQIAKRILHRELSIDSSALNALARVVFDRLTRSESWELTVHPQFADAIRGSLPAGSANKVRINADPSCAPGTFLVRSEDGSIDASVDSQLAEIEHGLTDRLSRK